MDDATLLALCSFGFVGALTYWAWTFFSGSDGAKLRTRLQSNEAAAAPAAAAPAVPLLTRLSQAVAKPFMPTQREKVSSARRNLGYAGIYSPSGVKTLYGFKFIFLLIGLMIGDAAGAFTDSMMICLPLGALGGFYAPAIWLKMRINSNRKLLEYGLADALDLMVVCVEAGLTVDAAMQRVGQELIMAHPVLSREMGITHMETRIGVPRIEALRNLGSRTGSPPLQALAAMLTQAERFGTSISQALRVHAESLRVARTNRAEEMAAKTSVKLTFPLVLFIFPATFLILIGPTVINLLNSPLFK